jgi:hypothetical protein
MWGLFPQIFDNRRCQLLGPFALIVQSSMGLIAFLSLVYKRSKEHPPRPWWIWLFDVMKQVMGAAGIHVFNVTFSILFNSFLNEPGIDDNPCVWYFLNILMDTTIGVPVLWFFLYIFHTLAVRMGIKEVLSGEYGTPPRWRAFFKQASLYMVSMICMKLVLYLFFWWMPFIDYFGALLISWTQFDPRVEVVFVMMVFPLV